jgi:ribosomal 50S subunit-associated protein YjgA (DUF615 family)
MKNVLIETAKESLGEMTGKKETKNYLLENVEQLYKKIITRGKSCYRG